MVKSIMRVNRNSGVFRVVIPMRLINEKGWENVTHVCVQSQWGDRFVIEKVAIDETPEKKDSGS